RAGDRRSGGVVEWQPRVSGGVSYRSQIAPIVMIVCFSIITLLFAPLVLLGDEAKIELVPQETPTVFADKASTIKVAFRDDADQQLGETMLQAVPADLLKQLGILSTNRPVGLLDPDGQLKPSLKKLAVEFVDLEKDAGLDQFPGTLAILGPFRARDSQPES